MPKAVTLAQAMTPFPYSITPERTVAEARAMMVEHDFHHLPVTAGEEIVGLLSDVDCRLAEALVQGGPTVSVDLVYRRDPYVVGIHAPLAEVVGEMATRRLDGALVTRQGRLAGILTHTDVCRVLADVLRKPSPDQVA